METGAIAQWEWKTLGSIPSTEIKGEGREGGCSNKNPEPLLSVYNEQASKTQNIWRDKKTHPHEMQSWTGLKEGQ